VGSFPPNPKGIFDLAGNVYEWVADDYSIVDPNRVGVLRGGGWTSYQAEHLHSGSRYPQPPDATADIYGFRVVLAKIPVKPEGPSLPAEGPAPIPVPGPPAPAPEPPNS
jgi:hypothetical protein